MRHFGRTFIVLTTLWLFPTGMASASVESGMAAPDRDYLAQLAHDTYQSILFLVDPQTGLPYDNSRFNRPDTSVTNIGLYLASLVAAQQLGLEKKNSAIQKAKAALASLERLPAWNGFAGSWNNVLELTPSGQDQWVSVLDSGNLAAGLIVTAEAFRPLRKRANRLLEAMRWDEVFSPKQGLLYGGYHLQTQELSRDWFLGQLGSDARLAYLIAIGQGRIPASAWQHLSRNEEVKYGLSYLTPGWQGGGMFMQFISGLFMDEAGTVLGHSAARFAFAQTVHAQVIGTPVWGWSACELPDGRYMGWNDIQDRYITPHASTLAVHFFPGPVTANLKKLEELGARRPFLSDGRGHDFGFHDSVDLETGEVDGHFLLLDQCMLFLSLVNYLDDGELRQTFARHPVIREAIRQIPDYHATDYQRERFRNDVASLGTEKVMILTEPLTVADDGEGRKVLSKAIRLINFTNRSYPGIHLMWRILQDETAQVVDEGDEVLDLARYTTVCAAPAKFRVTDNRYDDSTFLLETKLLDSQGTIVSEYLAFFPP